MTPDKKYPDHYYDVRVRDRLVASGVVDAEKLARHIAELPDLEGHAEEIPIMQPALVLLENE